MREQLRIKNFIFLFIAGVVNAFGVTMFLYPVQLYDSGVSGVSMLLDQVTPSYLTLSLFLLVINIPLFIFGLKRQGKVFTIYSIFSVCIYSIMSFLITRVLPINLVSSPLAKEDLLLCAIFGGMISGVGSGVVIRFGGAIDGIDILSVVFAKKIGISIGTFVMLFNLILYIICGVVIGSWILPLYSIITYFVGSKTIDYIVDGIDKSKCAMIITTKPSEITEVLSTTFNTSATLVDAVGTYSKTEKQILYFIINQFQINKVKEIVLSIDQEAFVSFYEMSEVVKKNK